MLRILTLATLILVTLFGCKHETDDSFVCQPEETYPCGVDSNKVNMRIVNVSSYDYCNVKVWGDRMLKNYGEIPKGDTSCYISFDTISSVPSIHLIFEGDTAGIEPGEYIPEPPDLAKGFYICKLSLRVVFLDTLLKKRYGYLDTEILPE